MVAELFRNKLLTSSKASAFILALQQKLDTKAGSILGKLCLTGTLLKESTNGFSHSSLEVKTCEEACSSPGTSHGAYIG